MNLGSVSKAIAGAMAGGLGSLGTAYVAIPDGVSMPWYGYVVVGVLNAALAFGMVYVSPRNSG